MPITKNKLHGIRAVKSGCLLALALLIALALFPKNPAQSAAVAEWQNREAV